MHCSKRVQLINDPTRIGILTGRSQLRRNRQLLQVQFSDGLRWVPEKQLKYVGEKRLSPLDMLENKTLGRPIDLRRTLTHVKLSGRLADVIYSMEATNTDFYAYQFKPVIKALESPSNGILIADEVGLGKTIEAGLIWTELRSRYDMRRLIILCPAALREKWRRELSTKIGVSAQICDAKETLDLLADENAQSRGFAIISSLQGLRPPKGWENNYKRGAAKLAQYLRSMENEDRLIDLLIIDEAHHLRNSETQTNELGRLFKNVSEYVILLTATPIHNRNEDLFSLLRILDPDTFTRQEVFTQLLEANAPLVKARDLILGSNFNINEFKELIQLAKSHPFLKSNRQISIIEKININEENLKKKDVRSRIAYQLETVNLLAHVVTRTRKREVKEWRVIREPIPEFTDLEPVEKRFYDLVSEVVIKYALDRQTNELFLLAQPQRQMSSSMAACLRSWQKRLIELEEYEDFNYFINGANKKASLGPLAEEIVIRSKDYVDLNELIEVDTKYKRLKEILKKYFSNHPKEKVILFSSFHATLDYLYERLESDGISSIILKGGQKETKDEIITTFSDFNGPSVLLSSEVGGEGVDLQFSRVVINYDLPWNPMRLEQRIGRIDRLGQNADKILIWNILCANTIDARIYERLYAKLDLCRVALGDFEAILGDEIRKLEIDLIAGQLTEEEQLLRIDQTTQALENLRQEEQRLEYEASHLVAYGDYILNQVQAARKLHRWISGSDLKRYVFDYLRMNYPGCDILQIGVNSLVFEIVLSDKAKFDLTEFIRNQKLPFNTSLISSSSRSTKYIFENSAVGSLKKNQEVISQFHPLVRMISHNITEHDEQLTPAVAIKLKKEKIDFEIESGLYLLGVVLWSYKGLQDSEKLSYALTKLDTNNNLIEADISEQIATVALIHGEDWVEARNVVDLNKVYHVANDLLLGSLDEEFEYYTNEIIAKNEDRADIQLRALEQHQSQQLEKLNQILERHQMLGRDALAKATEGRINALRNRVEQRHLKIESCRNINSQSKEIAIAIIQIE